MLVVLVICVLLTALGVVQAIRSRWTVQVELPCGFSASLGATFTLRKVPFKAAVTITNLRPPYDEITCDVGTAYTVGGVPFKVTRPWSNSTRLRDSVKVWKDESNPYWNVEVCNTYTRVDPGLAKVEHG